MEKSKTLHDLETDVALTVHRAEHGHALAGLLDEVYERCEVAVERYARHGDAAELEESRVLFHALVEAVRGTFADISTRLEKIEDALGTLLPRPPIDRTGVNRAYEFSRAMYEATAAESTDATPSSSSPARRRTRRHLLEECRTGLHSRCGGRMDGGPGQAYRCTCRCHAGERPQSNVINVLEWLEESDRRAGGPAA